MSVLADGYRRLAEELNIPICLTQVLIGDYGYDYNDNDNDNDNDNEGNAFLSFCEQMGSGLVGSFHFDFENGFSEVALHRS